jgi:hypothetical protein
MAVAVRTEFAQGAAAAEQAVRVSVQNAKEDAPVHLRRPLRAAVLVQASFGKLPL